MTKSYRGTLNACYIGYITQAIVNNFVPLLFLTFQRTYQIPLSRITFIVTINFAIQLIVDLLSARFADRIGYRRLAVIAHICAAAGLAMLGVLPDLFADPYVGLLAAVAVYAVGGGIIEVLISPIAEACPTEKKSAEMSLLHSFYCIGHVCVILVSTVFFAFFGIERWQVLAVIWAVVPLANVFLFARVPIAALPTGNEGPGIKKLVSLRLFWLLAVLMVCAGASEQAMSQWASAFAESGLKVSKTAGDLAGPMLFAALMGTSRLVYSKFSEKLKLRAYMLGSGLLCIASYLLASLAPNPILALIGCSLCGLSVGIFWPGTFSLASEHCPVGGTAMFALLALAGDMGCSLGPTVTGVVSGIAGGGLNTGILAAIVFPVILIAGLIYFFRA